jgi:hypothetical protein
MVLFENLLPTPYMLLVMPFLFILWRAFCANKAQQRTTIFSDYKNWIHAYWIFYNHINNMLLEHNVA